MDTKETLEKRKTFLINALYWGFLVGIALFLWKYVAPVLFPFFVGFLVASVLRKPILYMTQKFNGHRKIVCIVMLLFFLVCSSVVISAIGTLLFRMMQGIFTLLPVLFRELFIPLVEEAFEKMSHLFSNFDVSLLEMIEQNATQVLESIYQAIAHFSNGILASFANIISMIPTLFMKVVITIIAMFFITIDYEQILGFLKKQIPERKREVVREAKEFFAHTLPKIVLFYGVILSLTFVELFLGFTILKVPYAGTIAVIIALLDILPVLGTGTILIPWSVIHLLIGNYMFALGLFVLYVIITMIRNTIEPKLIGKHMGLHPVVTLASMLIGMKFFGIVGLFGLPIVISFWKTILEKKQPATLE